MSWQEAIVNNQAHHLAKSARMESGLRGNRSSLHLVLGDLGQRWRLETLTQFLSLLVARNLNQQDHTFMTGTEQVLRLASQGPWSIPTPK